MHARAAALKARLVGATAAAAAAAAPSAAKAAELQARVLCSLFGFPRPPGG